MCELGKVLDLKSVTIDCVSQVIFFIEHCIMVFLDWLATRFTVSLVKTLFIFQHFRYLHSRPNTFRSVSWGTILWLFHSFPSKKMTVGKTRWVNSARDKMILFKLIDSFHGFWLGSLLVSFRKSSEPKFPGRSQYGLRTVNDLRGKEQWILVQFALVYDDAEGE